MYFMQQETKSSYRSSWEIICEPAVKQVALAVSASTLSVYRLHSYRMQKNILNCAMGIFLDYHFFTPYVYNCIYIDMNINTCKNANRVCTRGTEY